MERWLPKGKKNEKFDLPCILELPLTADFAIIKAEKGDPFGNLWFKETARNFSPLMAMAGKVTVVEVEQLVGLGDIRPEDVHLPGVFVQRIYQGGRLRKYDRNPGFCRSSSSSCRLCDQADKTPHICLVFDHLRQLNFIIRYRLSRSNRMSADVCKHHATTASPSHCNDRIAWLAELSCIRRNV